MDPRLKFTCGGFFGELWIYLWRSILKLTIESPTAPEQRSNSSDISIRLAEPRHRPTSMGIVASIVCAMACNFNSPANDLFAPLPLDRAKALRSALLVQVRQSNLPELRKLARTVSRADIEITPEGARIGNWLFDGRDSSNMTITYLPRPTAPIMINFVYPVKYTAGAWTFEKLEFEKWK